MAHTSKGAEVEEVDARKVVRFVREQATRVRQGRIEKTEASNSRQGGEDTGEEMTLWRETLRTTLLNMPPDAFERLCQRLLPESGFIQVEVTGSSGDGGIDGHGVVRVAGLLSFPVIFQCKRYRSTVSAGQSETFAGRWWAGRIRA